VRDIGPSFCVLAAGAALMSVASNAEDDRARRLRAA
jgi:hypothetical protein